MTSMSGNARASASRAADSKLLENTARAGFIGYGVLHLLLAWLALQIAFGSSAEQGDQTGALRTLAAQPMGTVLVWAIIVGLVAMAIWQALEAAVGHRAKRGKERIAERVVSGCRTAIYLYLAWTGYQVVSGAGSGGSDSQQASGQLMSSTGGRWLVGLAGLVVLGVGIGMVVYGVLKKFERNLETERMSATTRRLARRLGVAGYAARGTAFAVVGFLILLAALTYDPAKARGLDAALHALASQSYGGLLLTLVALGFAAFAVYCVIQARYRKV